MANPRIAGQDGQRLLTPCEAAERMGVSPETLRGYRYRRTGPRYVSLSPRTFRYAECDVERYISERIVDPSARASLETDTHASRKN